MAKRVATRELTDRNWDDEEEPEEAGEFTQASDDVIKTRQIKKAKRRGVTGDDDSKPNIFSGFGGFKSTASGGANLFPSKTETKTDSNNSSKTENGKSESGKSESDFLMNLKSLNESVVTWIKQHVEKNPFCILTPIFKDYEKHLGELEREKKKKKEENTASSGDTDVAKTSLDSAKPASGFSFSTNGTGNSAPSFGGLGSSTSTFSSGLSGNGGFSFKAATSDAAPKSGFSFGAATNDTAPKSGFSFGAATSDAAPKSGFSFGAAVAKTDTTNTGGAGGGTEDDEYVPPPVEVSEVKEDGAYYSKRCKLFYQRDEKWVERGVGNLHLKLMNEKVQLVIRADTNLGNIMLNIIMSDSITVKKQGKNNVFFVCVPNPPFDPKADEKKPVPILLRVKTSDDAEDLISKIEEKRQ